MIHFLHLLNRKIITVFIFCNKQQTHHVHKNSVQRAEMNSARRTLIVTF